MFIAFSNCIDALYTIKTMCFDEYTASVSLRKLLSALVADWGFKIQEPFVDDDSSTTISIEEVTDIYKDLREQVLTLPKFGTDAGAKSEELQSIVEWLSNTVVTTFRKVVSVGNPKSNFCKLMKDLSDRYSVPNVPFDILFVPGSGTFEGYVGWGLSTAASADGRRCGMPIASDFSAAPTIQDGPEQPTYNDIYKSLKSWDNEYLNYGFPNGAEIDLNINEDFSKDDLSDFLNNFANEREIGGNVLTFTCADVETYQKAVQSPEKYNLLRVRMGGWSEMFIAMFHSHQKQHIRRPYYKC